MRVATVTISVFLLDTVRCMQNPTELIVDFGISDNEEETSTSPRQYLHDEAAVSIQRHVQNMKSRYHRYLRGDPYTGFAVQYNDGDFNPVLLPKINSFKRTEESEQQANNLEVPGPITPPPAISGCYQSEDGITEVNGIYPVVSSFAPGQMDDFILPDESGADNSVRETPASELEQPPEIPIAEAEAEAEKSAVPEQEPSSEIPVCYVEVKADSVSDDEYFDAVTEMQIDDEQSYALPDVASKLSSTDIEGHNYDGTDDQYFSPDEAGAEPEDFETPPPPVFTPPSARSKTKQRDRTMRQRFERGATGDYTYWGLVANLVSREQSSLEKSVFGHARHVEHNAGRFRRVSKVDPSISDGLLCRTFKTTGRWKNSVVTQGHVLFEKYVRPAGSNLRRASNYLTRVLFKSAASSIAFVGQNCKQVFRRSRQLLNIVDEADRFRSRADFGPIMTAIKDELKTNQEMMEYAIKKQVELLTHKNYNMTELLKNTERLLDASGECMVVLRQTQRQIPSIIFQMLLNEYPVKQLITDSTKLVTDYIPPLKIISNDDNKLSPLYFGFTTFRISYLRKYKFEVFPEKMFAEYLALFADKVCVRHHDTDGSNRYMIASCAYKAGELIFNEQTLLHTLHPLARNISVDHNLMELPIDWQRLLHLWLQLMSSTAADYGAGTLQLLAEYLSAEGVISQLAKESDPQRCSDYAHAAIQIRQRIKKRQQKRRGGGKMPSAEQIERMIHQLETNCHSRPLPAVAANEGACDDSSQDGTTEEEWVGVWLMASMMQHSCLPNATVEITMASDSDAAIISVFASRPIEAGQQITISYVDKEFWPYLERQQLLLRRGFRCECELCMNGVDYSRALMLDSDLFRPNGNGLNLTEHFDVVAVERMESELAEDAERLTRITNSMLNHLHRTFPGIYQHFSSQEGDHENFSDLLKTVVETLLKHDEIKSLMGPKYHLIHPFHSIVYQFINLNVYENSSQMQFEFDSSRLAPFLGCLWLGAVSQYLFPFSPPAIVQVSESHIICPSEDYKHHKGWLQKLAGSDPTVLSYINGNKDTET